MKIDRRTFLRISTISGIGAASGCGSDVDKVLLPMVTALDDMVAGKSLRYAATCRECPAGCGVLVDTREGRAVKIEGNPLHPENRGRICMRGQAALQGIYHPDRLTAPLLKENGRFREVDVDGAMAVLGEKTRQAAALGPNRVRMLTELPGKGLLELFSTATRLWNSDPPLIFEPLGCESLKAAFRILFGHAVLPDYLIHKSDFLISFGADFLETWLSPVSYTRRFKEMHGIDNGTAGAFFHVSSCQTLTAANADRWMCCMPGSEHLVALWLVRSLLEKGGGNLLEPETKDRLQHLVSPCSPDMVSEKTGLVREDLDTLLGKLMASKRPLVLGAASNSPEPGASSADLAALLLNLVLDPSLSLLDFEKGHGIAAAADHDAVLDFFDRLNSEPGGVLLLHRVNPLYAMPTATVLQDALGRDDLFVVCFSSMLDDTSQGADLVIPVRHPLESWDEYSGREGIVSLLQPVMAPPSDVPQVGDLFLKIAFGDNPPVEDYQSWIKRSLYRRGLIGSEKDWLPAVRRGGFFKGEATASHRQEDTETAFRRISPDALDTAGKLLGTEGPAARDHSTDNLPVLMTLPSIRFYDGRGADKPWLCEVPDPLTSVAWQTPVLIHPETLQAHGLAHEDVVLLETQWGSVEATAYETEGVHPQAVVIAMGQGHAGCGRYANGQGINSLWLMPGKRRHDETNAAAGLQTTVTITGTGRKAVLPHTDGSRIQHGRKIALSVAMGELVQNVNHGTSHGKAGLTMNDFPLTLPIPEGYDAARDIYPPHEHEDYRWAMVVDLDRCVGCGACAVACYAENNVAVVGEARMIEGREMAWLRVERYHDMADPKKITFLPMMCQHCDNAPCESVCPVYAPHHSKEGLNNQIYNRCIGTRFCSQNCPYKVRRFNWFDQEWPDPLQRQLNPDVTVRAKGVMEKCSFCVQRIKAAHGEAKNENRTIRDGEVTPACVQTCPTNALVFGNLMEPESRVRKLAEDPRAYQVMGYLNTKPAVIYLKKVLHDV